MTKHKYSAFQWEVGDVEMQLEGVNDALGKTIELTEDEKEDILDEAILDCEDEIMTIINETIQNIIIRRYHNNNIQ